MQDCHLIENGRFFVRRVMNGLRWEGQGAKPDGYLEVAAWPDRMVLALHVIPDAAIADGVLELRLNVDGAFRVSADPAGAAVERSPGAKGVTIRLVLGAWPAKEERSLAVILRPEGVPSDEPCDVTAHQSEPRDAPVSVFYDPRFGWHRVELRHDPLADLGADARNQRLERIGLVINNPSAVPHTERLLFADEAPADIVGVSPMIRDANGYPTGLPVQVSKDWHTQHQARFMGRWYHGFTMLTMPPRSSLTLEYACAHAFWGGVPAASDAQLCLVGWGSNQLWNQAALGSWGESLCFEPDQGQKGGAELDTRPLMVTGREGGQWQWTNNVGGADFLVDYDPSGARRHHVHMKTQYRRSGPVLTETAYTGRTDDGAIDLSYVVSLYRCDDITRGIYHFRYDVRKPTTFSRLVLFQAGSDDYSYTSEKMFALGDERGLIKEWPTQWGGDVYRTAPQQISGRVPWLSMHQAVRREENAGAWADRGIVIRSWDARLGGRPAKPWAAERGQKVRGTDTSLMDILPPPGVKALMPGDYVDAVVEHVVVPRPPPTTTARTPASERPSAGMPTPGA